MAVENDKHRERLEQFLRDYVGTRLELELLCFWSRHHDTKFSQSAVLYAMDSNKLDTQEALDTLVTRGLLQRQVVNGVALYSLSAGDDRRSLVLELGDRASEMQDRLLHHMPGLVAGNAGHRS